MGAQLILYLVFFPPLTIVLLRHVATRCRLGNGIRNRNDRRLPPSPPGLPIIGHLHLVGSHPHLSLREIADRYGGADGFMLLRFGQVPNLVVSSPHAAEAILREHDHTFASRPPSAVANIVHYGSSDVAMAPYGDYWRQVRRLVTTHVLSARKVSSFLRAREEEVRVAVARVREEAAARAAVDMTELLSLLANDVVCRAVSGKLFRAEGRNRVFKELIDVQAALLSGFNLEDYFPWVERFGVLTWLVCARAKALSKRWDELLEEIIHEHEGQSQGEDDDGDLIHVLLSLQQEFRLTRPQVKAVLVDMFAAGTDTLSILLEYVMIELIRNPQIMAKVQDEIIKNIPKGQEMVKEENLNSMSYLKAVIKETLRLYPPTPLLLPHFSMENCVVNGYAVPAATRVIVNAWAIGRDSRSWEKAEEFMPERFVESGSGDMSSDFRFVPFGAGRRMCPGINFGMAVVELTLANLLYNFRWELPDGMTAEDVDMTVLSGLTIRRKEKLLLVPRLLVHV